jgi:hypothetical protein
VTTVAVLSLVIGGLLTLLGLAVMVGGTAMAAWLLGHASDAANTANLTPEAREAAAKLAAAGTGFFAWIFGIIGVCWIVFGLPALIGGIGVMNRRSWGRILTIVMAILFILFGALELIGPLFLIGIIMVAYGVVSLVILFNSKYAAEFH